MAYRVQNSLTEQVAMFRNILGTMNESDLVIVTNDGKAVFSHKRLFCLFSKTVNYWLNSSSACENDVASLSVDASFKAVATLVTVLGSGKAVVADEKEFLEVIDVAELLGVDMENSEIEIKKTLEQLRSNKRKERRKNLKELNFEEFVFFKEEDGQAMDLNTAIGDDGYSGSSANEAYSIIRLPEESENTKELTDEEGKTSEVFNNSDGYKSEFSDESPEDPLNGSDVSSNTDVQNVANPNLKRHRTKTGKWKNHACEKCGERFAHKSNLKKHQQLHNEEKPFKCRECGDQFSTKSKLKRHKANKNKKFRCDKCSMAFVKGAEFQRHKFTHSKEKPFKCDICPKQFTQKYSLENHAKTYNSMSPEMHRETILKKQEKKRYPCNECDDLFITLENVRNHKKIIHSNIRPFACNQCTKSFPHTGALNYHNKKFHDAFSRNKVNFVLNI